jgi:PleD family two-component response regulator
LLSHTVRSAGEELGTLYLLLPHDGDESASRHLLAQLAHLMGKVAGLQSRHNRLQKLAITDELTGLYNSRYFRHFLTRIVERAREKLFPVTLLIFDIDDFKKYNDEYGHGVGDEILRQTANLMRRTCREHDLVARLGGDEFAVVFWEKEGPRQPKDPQSPGSARPALGPEAIYERFRKLLETQEFQGLGSGGKGMLTISAGLAVFPYHAATVDELIELADKRLMFGAKRGGKNSLVLVGNPPRPTSETRR